MFFSKSLSLNKLKHFLQDQYDIYIKQTRRTDEHLKEDLIKLEALIKDKKREDANVLSSKIENYTDKKYKKSVFKKAFDVVLALGVALIAATVIRQTWFELYEIPTGSMRPTFREQDHVSVSKTAFGINIPLQTEHFYFEPNNINRGGVVIFSGDGIDLGDTDSTFLYIFPYKKRYVKRLIGKPGDSLYFYGGTLYGVDKEGNEITDFKNKDWNKKLEYVPFTSFEGKSGSGGRGKLVLKQMNQDIGRISLSTFGDMQGEIHTKNGWIKDNPELFNKPHDQPVTYSDLWGIGNFAKTRILTDSDGKRSLEINHHPSLTSSSANLVKERDGFNFSLAPKKSIIPLEQKELDTLMDNMYTARFVVKGEKAARYNQGHEHFDSTNPTFQGVANGTYEIYYGKGYEVGFAGMLKELPQDHPLMKRTSENIVKLYNLGIEIDKRFDPSRKNAPLPTRFAYFKEGDLYLLGAPFLKKDDPLLTKLVASEKEKAKTANYIPFIDAGAPPNSEYIKNFGLTIPDKHYLVLGDNHAMSGDSRFFGFVPEENMQGAPSLILWPSGERWGIPNMVAYPFITLSRLIVWSIAAVALGTWWYLSRKRLNRPIQ